MKPNFLIVGAAKAGTTSLVNYLTQHNQVFVPEAKELRFFVKDVIKNINTRDPLLPRISQQSVLNEEDYFQRFCTEVMCAGEASVHYLYHHANAIPNIKHKIGDVPIIIMLRDPVRRAISNYEYLYNIHNNSLENELANESMYRELNYNSFWFYTEQGLYSQQVVAYLESFSQVKLLIFEEFVKNVQATMSEVFEFLGVSPIHVSAEVFNRSAPKSTLGRYVSTYAPKGLLSSGIAKSAKHVFHSFFYRAIKYNPDTVKSLRQFFLDDIKLMEEILGRSLKTWRA